MIFSNFIWIWWKRWEKRLHKLCPHFNPFKIKCKSFYKMFLMAFLFHYPSPASDHETPCLSNPTKLVSVSQCRKLFPPTELSHISFLHLELPLFHDLPNNHTSSLGIRLNGTETFLGQSNINQAIQFYFLVVPALFQ